MEGSHWTNVLGNMLGWQINIVFLRMWVISATGDDISNDHENASHLFFSHNYADWRYSCSHDSLGSSIKPAVELWQGDKSMAEGLVGFVLSIRISNLCPQWRDGGVSLQKLSEFRMNPCHYVSLNLASGPYQHFLVINFQWLWRSLTFGSLHEIPTFSQVASAHLWFKSPISWIWWISMISWHISWFHPTISEVHPEIALLPPAMVELLQVVVVLLFKVTDTAPIGPPAADSEWVSWSGML